ncbi:MULTISPECIES: NAD/NADP octopine/nopaline dehydrogenase family protein [unclassified Streptomyces]|uniref:NAD/NADP octopine/nopaline dehydrogenase family protein n=1 Tax=unclassified Streptomyces TaxID=2593676 RepID=UPI002252786A|nr:MULTISPECIES: NAD/NADP octopine/nopaline dehydrogenase family protein [unclassified Streptomyces]MCX5054601.1 NAD/NADP octopine/nopaline dehydrogenase family protein [Streptomyces sp. NBC_00474]
MHDTLTGEIHSVPTERADFLLPVTVEPAALTGADCVFVTVPDIPSVRSAVVSRLLECLAHRSVSVVMIRGGQGGALWLAERLADPRAASWEVLLVEDSLYGCRVQGSHVEYKRKDQIGVAHYGQDPKIPLEALARALGEPGWLSRFTLRTPSELVFDPLGYYIHAAVALDPSNVVRTARGERYLHYSEGIDPTLAEQLDAMDTERVALAASYGVPSETFPQILRRQYGHEPRSDFYATMAATRDLYRSLSPSDVDDLRLSRTLREDIPALFTMLELARVQDVPMPVTGAFADALPYLLDRIGLALADIDRYPSLNPEIDGEGVRRLLDERTKPRRKDDS